MGSFLKFSVSFKNILAGTILNFHSGAVYNLQINDSVTIIENIDVVS